MKSSRTPTCEHGNRHTKVGTGGLYVVPRGMLRAVKEPCVECPLRRDSAAGYLGGYTPEMYLEILHGPASIACHKSPGFKAGDLSTQRHCTGVAGFRANIKHLAVLGGRLSAAQDSTDFVGPADMFFGSDAEFITHHKPGQRT